jgi:hypothetical protein
MSERKMRTFVTSALRPLHAIAVENPVLPGTPDVNYIEGWIELKWLRAWPKNPASIVRIPHFTKQQVVWHFKRRRAGGQSWILIQCRREWLLMDGKDACLINHLNKEMLIKQCVAYWYAGLGVPEFREILTEPQAPFTPGPTL